MGFLQWLRASWFELLVPEAEATSPEQALGLAAFRGEAMQLLACWPIPAESAGDESASAALLDAIRPQDASRDAVHQASIWPFPVLQLQSPVGRADDSAESMQPASINHAAEQSTADEFDEFNAEPHESQLLALCSRIMYRAEEASVAAHEAGSASLDRCQSAILEASMCQARLLRLHAAFEDLQLQRGTAGPDVMGPMLDALLTQLEAAMLTHVQWACAALAGLLPEHMFPTAKEGRAACVRHILRVAQRPEVCVSSHASSCPARLTCVATACSTYDHGAAYNLKHGTCCRVMPALSFQWLRQRLCAGARPAKVAGLGIRVMSRCGRVCAGIAWCAVTCV